MLACLIQQGEFYKSVFKPLSCWRKYVGVKRFFSNLNFVFLLMMQGCVWVDKLVHQP
jgi:hypothetical protein